MFSLDRESAVPLSEQIDAHLRALIHDGRLPEGARLTSIRQLAAQLEISPNTVVVAYDRLVADGLVFSRGTAGYFVADAGDAASAEAPLEAGDEQEPVWLVQQSNDARPGHLQASSGALPLSWLEDAIPVSLVQRALSKKPGAMATRCPPQGLPDLRERIATLMRSQDIAVDANRLLTTSGGTHAIDLIVRAFVKPGDAVIVEDPGYFLLFARLRQAGARPIAVARRPDGIDLAELEAACIAHKPRLMFLQTTLHNPTGWGSSASNLHRVLKLADQHDLLIAEDDTHGHFQPVQTTRIAQLADLERVIYFSSFCKVLSPGLRMGYVAADPALLKPLMREKIYSLLTTATMNELVLLEMLSTGRFRKHVERLQQRLDTARAAAASHLREAGITLDSMAEAGLFLWGGFPAGVDLAELVKEAYRQGIVLAHGSTFRAGTNTPENHVRFNIVASQDKRLADFLTPRLKPSSIASATLAKARARAGE